MYFSTFCHPPFYLSRTLFISCWYFWFSVKAVLCSYNISLTCASTSLLYSLSVLSIICCSSSALMASHHYIIWKYKTQLLNGGPSNMPLLQCTRLFSKPPWLLNASMLGLFLMVPMICSANLLLSRRYAAVTLCWILNSWNILWTFLAIYGIPH